LKADEEDVNKGNLGEDPVNIHVGREKYKYKITATECQKTGGARKDFEGANDGTEQ
jgi:hypothetical protein